MKPKHSSVLVGTAGVYFVAAKLAAEGFHAAPTFGNAPSVDILVGLPDGAATLSLQVKTAMHAARTRGKGNNKQWHHYEWDIGKKSARLNKSGLFFAFVNLKGMEDKLPDVFIVPSPVIYEEFQKYDLKSRVMWHPKLEQADTYKNRWDILREYLLKNSDVQKSE